MIQQTKNGYIRRTSSGVMKCGSTLSFGSKAKNAEWEKHYKEVDAQKKHDKEGHGYWAAGAQYKWNGVIFYDYKFE